jgi:hypothetical protein
MNQKAGIYQVVLAWLMLGVFLLPAGNAAAGQKAEWEITTTMEIPGMPFAMPSNVMRQCLEDQGVPYQESDVEECEVVSKNVSGNTINWKVVCEGREGKSEMTGVSTYTGDTMETRVRMLSSAGDISMHMTGKRLGPCR